MPRAWVALCLVLAGCESGTLTVRYRNFEDEMDATLIEGLEHENVRLIDILGDLEHPTHTVSPCPSLRK